MKWFSIHSSRAHNLASSRPPNQMTLTCWRREAPAIRESGEDAGGRSIDKAAAADGAVERREPAGLSPRVLSRDNSNSLTALQQRAQAPGPPRDSPSSPGQVDLSVGIYQWCNNRAEWDDQFDRMCHGDPAEELPTPPLVGVVAGSSWQDPNNYSGERRSRVLDYNNYDDE